MTRTRPENITRPGTFRQPGVALQVAAGNLCGEIGATAVLVATDVNAEGYREILRLDIGSADGGATWTAWPCGLLSLPDAIHGHTSAETA